MTEITNIEDALKNSALFKGFSEQVLTSLREKLTPCDFKKGNVICLKGDESDCLYVVTDGELEITVSSLEGKVITLGILSAGDVVGEIGLLDKGPRTANVIAKTNAKLYKLSRDDFDSLLSLFGPQEMKALTSYICNLFRRATNSLEETAFMDADTRVARKIYDLFKESENEDSEIFELSVSQVELGRMCGLSREAANKALSHLEEKNLLKREYKKIIISDISQLEELAQRNEL